MLISEPMLSKEAVQTLKKINASMSFSLLVEQAGIYSICVSSLIFQIVNCLPLTLFESWLSC